MPHVLRLHMYATITLAYTVLIIKPQVSSTLPNEPHPNSPIDLNKTCPQNTGPPPPNTRQVHLENGI